MPRYFFDTFDGDELIRDEEGVILPTRESARVQALAALPKMTNGETPDGDRRTFYVNVRSEAGPIYTACLELSGRWLD